jgi:DNA primase
VLTESVIDAATLLQYTEEATLALYGTNGFTKEHEQVIKELGQLEEVVLFFDGDEAGRAAVEKYRVRLRELRSDIKISYVETPEGEDVNNLVQGHEGEILTHLIKDRKFLFSNENKNGERKSSRGKLHTENAELLVYKTNHLQITILGGIKITGLDRLRVTLKIEHKEYSHHLPVRFSLDLYHAKQVESLVQKMSESLELGTSESEKVISQMTTELECYRSERLEQL